MSATLEAACRQRLQLTSSSSRQARPCLGRCLATPNSRPPYRLQRVPPGASAHRVLPARGSGIAPLPAVLRFDRDDGVWRFPFVPIAGATLLPAGLPLSPDLGCCLAFPNSRPRYRRTALSPGAPARRAFPARRSGIAPFPAVLRFGRDGGVWRIPFAPLSWRGPNIGYPGGISPLV